MQRSLASSSTVHTVRAVHPSESIKIVNYGLADEGRTGKAKFAAFFCKLNQVDTVQEEERKRCDCFSFFCDRSGTAVVWNELCGAAHAHKSCDGRCLDCKLWKSSVSNLAELDLNRRRVLISVFELQIVSRGTTKSSVNNWQGDRFMVKCKLLN